MRKKTAGTTAGTIESTIQETAIKPNSNSSSLSHKKPKVLLKDKSKITLSHLDSISQFISESYVDTEYACVLSGVSYDSFKQLLKSPKMKLSELAHDMVKQAEARRFLNLVQAAKMGERNSQKLLEYCEPRSQDQYQIQMTYEVNILMDVVKTHVDSSTWKEVIKELRQMHSGEVLARYDDVLYQESPVIRRLK